MARIVRNLSLLAQVRTMTLELVSEYDKNSQTSDLVGTST